MGRRLVEQEAPVTHRVAPRAALRSVAGFSGSSPALVGVPANACSGSTCLRIPWPQVPKLCPAASAEFVYGRKRQNLCLAASAKMKRTRVEAYATRTWTDMCTCSRVQDVGRSLGRYEAPEHT